VSRTFILQALVLKTLNSGESNRDAWFLTAEEGIIRATVFGGPKSRLRAHVAPFHRGTLWIYHDPVRDSRKVTDFDVRSWRPGLRELYERTMAAGATADTILASHGGGGAWEEALNLADSVLDALENAGEEGCLRIFVHFLWKWAAFLGLRPELACACGAPADGLLWFDRREGIFLCPSCAGLGDSGGGAPAETTDFLPLNPGGRRWLRGVENLDPAQLTRYIPDPVSLRQIRAALVSLMAGILGRELSTWNF
jgi:DNA repair protein RecO (recombination protein O)